jgi:hypothetical protein
MVYRPPPPFIMNGRHPELPPQHGAIYRISRLRATFCGSAAVVGGSGAE